LFIMFLFHNQFNGTEWPIMRWCAVKKLLTLTLLVQGCQTLCFWP